jgi:hypothetical protein
VNGCLGEYGKIMFGLQSFRLYFTCSQVCSLLCGSCRVPQHCPAHVAQLVRACLSEHSSSRPTAQQVVEALSPGGAGVTPA